MRVGIVVALALAALAAPRIGAAQNEAADAGVDPDAFPSAGESDGGAPPAPAQPSVAPPAPAPPTCAPAAPHRSPVPPPEHPWPYFGGYGRSRHHGVLGAAHPRNGKRLEALSFLPFLAAGALSTAAVGLAAAGPQLAHDPSEDEDGSEQGQVDEDSRAGARRTMIYAVPITGTLATLPFSLMIAASLSRDRIEGAIFGGALAGTVFGLGLDVGMACVLYFYSSSIAATLIPPLVGLVVLPPIFGSIGAHLVANHRRARTISVLPPAPTALVSPSGRAAPGLVFGGAF
jgi:hypothetical protein